MPMSKAKARQVLSKSPVFTTVRPKEAPVSDAIPVFSNSRWIACNNKAEVVEAVKVITGSRKSIDWDNFEQYTTGQGSEATGKRMAQFITRDIAVANKKQAGSATAKMDQELADAPMREPKPGHVFVEQKGVTYEIPLAGPENEVDINKPEQDQPIYVNLGRPGESLSDDLSARAKGQAEQNHKKPAVESPARNPFADAMDEPDNGPEVGDYTDVLEKFDRTAEISPRHSLEDALHNVATVMKSISVDPAVRDQHRGAADKIMRNSFKQDFAVVFDSLGEAVPQEFAAINYWVNNQDKLERRGLAKVLSDREKQFQLFDRDNVINELNSKLGIQPEVAPLPSAPRQASRAFGEQVRAEWNASQGQPGSSPFKGIKYQGRKIDPNTAMTVNQLKESATALKNKGALELFDFDHTTSTKHFTLGLVYSLKDQLKAEANIAKQIRGYADKDKGYSSPLGQMLRDYPEIAKFIDNSRRSGAPSEQFATDVRYCYEKAKDTHVKQFLEETMVAFDVSPKPNDLNSMFKMMCKVGYTERTNQGIKTVRNVSANDYVERFLGSPARVKALNSVLKAAVKHGTMVAIVSHGNSPDGMKAIIKAGFMSQFGSGPKAEKKWAEVEKHLIATHDTVNRADVDVLKEVHFNGVMKICDQIGYEVESIRYSDDSPKVFPNMEGWIDTQGVIRVEPNQPEVSRAGTPRREVTAEAEAPKQSSSWFGWAYNAASSFVASVVEAASDWFGGGKSVDLSNEGDKKSQGFKASPDLDKGKPMQKNGQTPANSLAPRAVHGQSSKAVAAMIKQAGKRSKSAPQINVGPKGPDITA